MNFDWTAFWLICICGLAFAWDWRIKRRVSAWIAPRMETWLCRHQDEPRYHSYQCLKCGRISYD